MDRLDRIFEYMDKEIEKVQNKQAKLGMKILKKELQYMADLAAEHTEIKYCKDCRWYYNKDEPCARVRWCLNMNEWGEV